MSLEASLVVFGVATTASVKLASSFQTCHSFKELLLSRPPSLVATSTFVSAQSSAAYLVIPVATCIKFLSIFLMSRPHNLDCASPKTTTLINQLLSFLLCHFLHFYSASCCIFLLLFLLSFTHPANNKLGEFLHIYAY